VRKLFPRAGRYSKTMGRTCISAIIWNVSAGFNGKGQVVFLNVLITGATKGIGRAIAAKYLDSGKYKVFGAGTDQKALSRLEKKHGKRFSGIRIDLLEKADLSGFVKEVKRRKIQILINNAGINRIASVDKISDGDWNDIIRLNLTTPMILTKAVSGFMKKKKAGWIVNISSIYSVISRSMRASYSSSKSGLNGLTRAAALDLAKYKILVNAVSPGFTETQLTKTILSKKEIKALASQVPLKRMAQPKEIADCVYLLGSPSNSYITGQNIVIDGGYSIK